MDNYLALDFVLSSHGGVCAIASTDVAFGSMKQARYNWLYVALRKKLFGSLRLILMLYGICSLGLGWAIVSTGSQASYHECYLLFFLS